MSNPKFCKNCKWSQPEERSEWTLRCINPEVNSKDSWALSSSTTISGTTCRDERNLGWFEFPACGMKGKQYSPSMTYQLRPNETYHGSLKNLDLY